MHVFYEPELTQDSTFVLNSEESRHLTKVLRLDKGNLVTITDGKGNFFIAEIIHPEYKGTTLLVKEHITPYPRRDFYIHIAIAPTKSMDRIEWMVEKCVELGIEEISFIRTERSERKLINRERIKKIAVSAMKQSVKANLPVLSELTDFNSFLKGGPFMGQKFIGFLDEQNPETLYNISIKKNHYTVLIGPEGDFTPLEIEQAKQTGFKPISLSPYRLRTETAGIVACNILNIKNL